MNNTKNAQINLNSNATPEQLNALLKNANNLQEHLAPHIKKQNICNIWVGIIINIFNAMFGAIKNVTILLFIVLYGIKELKDGGLIDRLVDALSRQVNNWGLAIICATIALVIFIKKKYK